MINDPAVAQTVTEMVRLCRSLIDVVAVHGVDLAVMVGTGALSERVLE